MKSKAFIICTLYSVLCTLTIQAQDLLDYPLDTVNGEEVYRYEVEKSIGLYRIGVNFQVSQDDILRLNPQLHEHGVRYGETLFIPTGRKVIIESKPVVLKTTVTETPVPVEQPAVTEAPQAAAEEPAPVMTAAVVAAAAPVAADTVELALMLPFESQQTKRSGNADRILEFYQGALLALKELQDPHHHYRLRVYDTERSERRVNALCDSTELEHVKGVIGLVYPIQIARMAEWCDTHEVPLVLPFSDDSQMTLHRSVLQFNSTDQQESDTLCRWFIEHDSTIHCVAINVREADMSESVRTLRKTMQSHQIPVSTINLRDLLNDSIAYALDTAKENLILLHSDKFQHIRILLPHLEKMQAQGFRIRILSQYSWIKEDIRLPQLYTSMFGAEAVLEAYENNWSTYFTNERLSEAPRFDLLGYDLTQALVAWLRGEQQTHGLQSDIRWKQIDGQGWQNEAVKVIKK